uniref:solute carrier family 40 member 1-like n=1 Tax=Styela clava TaxID=7725 RepID=UPI00193974F2|nr:solute carrier family 40 member 1-like [Styela clava]
MMNKSKLIYVSHFLSAWGDRMWNFAVAIFLMDLASESLLLPAVFGLTLSGSVLMFGPLVGEWIDRSPRLRAAQTSLITQNSTVAACAIILLVQKIAHIESNAFLLFVKISAVFLGAIARLASVASSIIVQKDWIVVIAGGDETFLTSLNAMLRRIDLCTKFLAPLVCGQLITLVSLTFGCAFVAGWNLVSMFVEYILLRIVYDHTPALALKVKKSRKSKRSDDASNNPMLVDSPDADVGEDCTVKDELPLQEIDNVSKETLVESPTANKESDKNDSAKNENNQQSQTSIWRKIFSFLLIIPKGWKQYMSQSVAKAGIGLACLYMTVLGLDAITISYAYNQCFSELLVGILLAVSGLTGIVATFIFTPLSAKIGIIKAGLLSSVAQILTLIPCVMSVFAPGSPFFLLPQNKALETTATPTFTPYNTIDENITISNNHSSINDGVFLKCMDGIDPPPSYLSLTMLTAGIVLARIGLWGFDLAVTQLFQQHVPEQERGVVGGVQSSLNYLMDLMHFILVIALPQPDKFGILVILSAIFVTAGHFLFALFAHKELGGFLCC